MSATSPSERPRLVEVAFWALLLGAVLLIGAGLLVATVSFDLLRAVAPETMTDEQLRGYLMFRRSAGVLYALAGAGLAFLTGRLRGRQPQYRRATVALGLVTVAVVAALTVIVGTGVAPLIALLPVLSGAVLLTRPTAMAWFQGAHDGDIQDRGEQ
ncbi:hypothetical protein [Mycolicibacterium thermoresistibile]